MGILLLFMVVAYLFSIGLRMYWPMHFANNTSMMFAGELMINTNDGYLFSTGARDILNGFVAEDVQKTGGLRFSPGLVFLTVYATKILPFSLETISLYLPAVISSLIVIPIVLVGRLLGHTFVGFLAALLASISWSYYNRTMVGYYDTDMFSVLLQFVIFYTMLLLVYKKNLFSIALATFFIFMYPYFYSQGMTIVYAMFIVLSLYLWAEYKKIIVTNETNAFKENGFSFYGSLILLSIPLMIGVPLEVRVVCFVVCFALLAKIKPQEKYLLTGAVISVTAFLYFGNVLNMFIYYIFGYLDRGVEAEGLHFYQVIQTVREAGAIPFSMMANRISGSQIGVLISLMGYVVLVMRHKPFVIALPLIGVGVLSLWTGLRFTVYAVPVAAISAVYLFYVMADMFFKNKMMKYGFMILSTAMMIYPNITHIIDYKVPTVLNAAEVNDLTKLDKISGPKDYTLAWWDYGYPIWFYSNTNTLIDGGKHTNDNFIVSKIMQTTSSELAANLSRLAIETYVDSNYSKVTDILFSNKQKDQIEPSFLLSELENGTYSLPKKTRDIYLYLPYRMMRIFSTVSIFGNLDLMTGKAKRTLLFYPARAIQQTKNIVTLQNGIQFDVQNGYIISGNKEEKVKRFVATSHSNNGKIDIKPHLYHADGNIVVLYMKSYGEFIVMDVETFHSMYVQMFLLGKYDKNLFELVVSSPYSKIYKVK